MGRVAYLLRLSQHRCAAPCGGHKRECQILGDMAPCRAVLGIGSSSLASIDGKGESQVPQAKQAWTICATAETFLSVSPRCWVLAALYAALAPSCVAMKTRKTKPEWSTKPRMCGGSPVKEELAALRGTPAWIIKPGWVHVELLPCPCVGALHQQRCQRNARGPLVPERAPISLTRQLSGVRP